MSSVPTCFSIVRFAVVAVALLFGLGWLLLQIAFRGEEFSPLEKMPISFSLSVGSIAVIGVVSHFLELNLKAVQYAIALLFLLLLFWQGMRWRTVRRAHRKPDGVRWGSGSVTLDQPANLFGKPSSLGQTFVAACSRSLSRPDTVILIFAAFCSFLTLWSGPWLSHTADSFYHLASARRLVDTQGVLPKGAFVAYESEPSAIDPTAGTWHLVLALLSVLSGVDLTWIWFYLPALLVPVLVLALYSFTTSLFKNQGQAVLATILYFLLEYSLDFRMIAQPNRMGFALFWIALLFAVRYLDTGKFCFFGLTSLLGLVLVALHFTIFEFFLVSIGAYALFYTLFSARKGINPELRRAWIIAFIPLLFSLPIVLYKASAISWLWRWSGGLGPFRETIELGHGLYILDWGLLFPRTVSVQTLSFILLLLLIPACWKRDRALIFLFSNMLIVPLMMFNPIVVTMLQGRTTELVLTRLPLMLPYPLVLGFLFYQLGVTSLSRDWILRKVADFFRTFIFCVSAYVLFSQVSENLIQLYSPFSDYKYSMSVSRSSWLLPWEDPYKFICDNIPQEAVVAADPVSNYYIGGLTGRFVIALPRTHTPPGIPDVRQRVEGSLGILDQNVDLKTTVSLLRKWDADYIFVDLTAPGVAALSPQNKFDRYSSNFQKIYDKGDVSIYHYNRAVPFVSWDVAAAPALCSDSETRVSADMVLASCSLDEEPIEPNQGVAFTLGWKPLREIEENQQVEFRFAGVNSGCVFSETFDLVEDAVLAQRSWKPGDVYQETYFVFMADDLPLDAYDLSIGLGGEGEIQEVALGQIRLKESYEGKDFEGLTDFCEGCSGWMRHQNYAVARELGATMSKSIHPVPAGDYQVLLTVYDHQGQGSNQVEVTLNGVSRVVEWSGTEEGERELSVVFEGQGGGSEVTITSLKREQWYIVVSEVTIVPMIGER